MPFDPSTAKLVQSASSGFDPSTAKLIESDPSTIHMGSQQQSSAPNQPVQSSGLQLPPNPNILERAAASPLVQGINAVGGGAQETLANSIKYAGGLIGDLTNSPKITQGAEALGNKLAPPGFVQQAQQNHPYLSMAGNAIGGTAAMGATGLAASAALPESVADYAANAVIGAATSGRGLKNRAIGAGLGAAVTGVAKVAGDLINKAVVVAGIPEKLNSVVNEANEYLKGQTSDQAAQASVTNMWNIATKVRDSLYNDFKGTAGEVESKTLANQASQTVKDLSDVMTPGQKGAFTSIANQASSVKNLNDLHELDKSIGQMKALFLKSGTAPDVGKAFNAIKDTSSGLLDSQAEKLGAGDALQLAKKYNKEVIAPLQDIGADKVARGEVNTDGFLAKFIKSPTNSNPTGSPEALGNLLNSMDSNGREIIQANLINRVGQAARVGADGFDPTKGIKVIDDNIKLYGLQLGPDTVNALNGMKTLLKQAKVEPSSAQKAAAGIGTMIAHPVGVVLNIAKAMVDNPITRPALDFIGSHPAGAQLARQVLTSSGAVLTGKITKQVLGNQPNQK